MTRGEKLCIRCGKPGHVSASCPQEWPPENGGIRWLAICLALGLLLAIALTGCATAPTESPEAAELRAKCAADGGCSVWTRKQLESLLRATFEAGKAVGQEKRI